MSGGTHGTLATFPVGEKVPSTDPAYATYQDHLGSVIEQSDGKRFRLVQSGDAAAIAALRAVVWTAAATYEVENCDGLTDRIVGMTIAGQKSVADNDLFWVQILGRCEGVLGDGTAWAAGDYVRASADTDEGKLERAATSGTTYAEGQTVFRAIDATTTDGDQATLEIIKELN